MLLGCPTRFRYTPNTGRRPVLVYSGIVWAFKQMCWMPHTIPLCTKTGLRSVFGVSRNRVGIRTKWYTPKVTDSNCQQYFRLSYGWWCTLGPSMWVAAPPRRPSRPVLKVHPVSKVRSVSNVRPVTKERPVSMARPALNVHRA